ncbi:MAG: glycoside hydrolase family 127 protein [Candidatus Poribacteria bacterium]|nr:glycoside hydrolase family 127 protein [Candidatus Poribacteria bacterium]
MTDVRTVRLNVSEDKGMPRRNWPVSRGVPLPPGELYDLDSVWVADADGQPVLAQFRELSRWPDGSLKWVLADFCVDVPAEGETAYAFCYGQKPASIPSGGTIQIEENEERLTVCTGPLRFSVNRRRFSLIESAELGRTGTDGAFVPEHEVVRRDGTSRASTGEAWVRICESFRDADGKRYLYGMGGNCLASLDNENYTVEMEEAGPLRAVIKCSGTFEADIPAHHYSGYRPFRFVMRIYAYAGQTFLRVLHTVVVACNPRETEVEEIGVHVPIDLPQPLRFGVASVRPTQGTLEADEAILLAQRSDNHFRLQRQSPGQSRLLAEGERTEGWMTIAGDQFGMGVGLRYMPEEYPKALRTTGTGNGLDVFLWKDPDGGRLNFKRYAEAVSWGEGEGVYADGTGTAKTSEFFICFYKTSESVSIPDRLRGLLAPPHVSIDPAWAAHCEVSGGFAPADADRFPKSERMMTGFLDWLTRNIQLGRWYGFFDWGDVLAAWEHEANDWRFYGRWGWCNSEWDARHGVWIQYLRTGDSRYFQLGEAMTRHSVDVDTCHFHPFRPYMVGGCFRHSVDHFGDEPCASHTFVDNWVDYYYLTGDARTYEVLREAGEFFLRYRWTEDPAHSFSLRSIANALRGLLYVYEVTGDPKFRERAEALYAVIVRGQNEDGSWHKRFQVSTPDRLPNQAPYGMATEGTTLAVEMGTTPPFTDAEFRKWKGGSEPPVRILPPEEQKGYQTHYLMIGLELLHRMTGREDVAAVYCRAVDWFCGYPAPLNAETALQQRYGGVLCRHLAYAYQLTGKREYLEIGQAVLQRLIEDQDWSDDLRRRGAVELSPTTVSLLFFGVPYLLGRLQEAGMDEC